MTNNTINNLIFVDCEGHGPAPTLNDPVGFEFGAVAYPSRQTFHGTGEALAAVNRAMGDPRKAKADNPNMIKKKSLESLRDELQGMKDDVVYLRNDMAHAKAGKHPQTGRPHLISKYGGKERHFDDAECIKVRKSILKHFQSIDGATSYL